MRSIIFVLFLTFASLSAFAKIPMIPKQVVAITVSAINAPVGSGVEKIVVMSNAKVLFQFCPLNPMVSCTTSRTDNITTAQLREIERLSAAAVNNPEAIVNGGSIYCKALPTKQTAYSVTNESLIIGFIKSPCGDSVFRNLASKKLVNFIKVTVEELNEKVCDTDL